MLISDLNVGYLVCFSLTGHLSNSRTSFTRSLSKLKYQTTTNRATGLSGMKRSQLIRASSRRREETSAPPPAARASVITQSINISESKRANFNSWQRLKKFSHVIASAFN